MGMGRGWVAVAMVVVGMAMLVARVQSQSSLEGMFAANPMQFLASSKVVATDKNYITYGALGANTAPCPATAAGSSYYSNCKAPTPQPYLRSCTQVTRCARG